MEEIVDLTKNLIKFKTFSHDYEQLDTCTKFIEDFLIDADIEYKRIDSNKVPSILVLPEQKTVPVLLMSHIDVVAAPDELFVPVVKDSKIFGRGSYDDKYAAALSLVMFKNKLSELRKNGKSQKDMDFGILITGDEEVGGENGARTVLENITPEFCIVLDGGDLDEVIIKEKGILRITLLSKGKTCHSARPWLGENAIDNLVKDYAVIMDQFKSSKPDNWHPTVNPAIVKGGQAANQVPDACKMIFDIRYTENDPVKTLISDMQDRVKGEIIVNAIEPVFIAEPTGYLDMLTSLDHTIETGFAHGASDARHLMKYKLNGVVWGCSGNLSHHSLNEHVEIDSIHKLYDRLNQFFDIIGQDRP